MKGILILCTLIGASIALVPDMEYHYKYEGRLGMGIPEIRNKYSGTGIKATVTVQVMNSNKAIIKLSDIMVGEYMGDIGIKIINRMPLEYSPLPSEWKILEKPYEVSFDMDKMEVLVVPKSDIEWVVNIRKSIAQLFLLEPIRSNFGLSKVFNAKDSSLDAFTLYEPTLFGTCSVDYAFLPVGFTSMDDKQNIEVIQKLDEDYFLLTRSINFDKCKEYVYSEAFNAGKLNYESALAEDVTSRSSIMNVKLVGKPGQFVMQEGNVDGFYALKPFSVSEKMMMMTSQQIHLKSSNKIAEKLIVPSPNRVIKTLYSEISSPFAAPANSASFVNYYGETDPFGYKASSFRYLTGIHMSPNFSKKCVKIIDEAIEETARLTISVEPMMSTKEHSKTVITNEGKITNNLEKLVELSFNVDWKDLEDLFNTYYNDKTEVGQLKLTLLIDICASGGYTPVKMIVNEMKKGRITPERITSIFSTWTNSFFATPVLKDIMTWVKTLDFNTHPIMMSNVLINWATILKNVCVMPNGVHFHKIIYGTDQCDKRLITEEFIPHLKQMFETTKEVQHRRSIVHALSNLGVSEAIKFVSEIATGNHKADVNVRETAILGLSFSKVMTTLTKDNIFDLLMPIVHDIKEDEYLRQIAIKVLVSHKPSPSWWQRLAISTWKEPSESVGSFIYYLIKNNYHNTVPEHNHDARISHFVLQMTKPFPRFSTYSQVYGKHIPELNSGVLFSSTVFHDDVNKLPRSVHTKFEDDVGGDKFTVFESMLSTFVKSDVASDVLKELKNVIPEELKKIIQMAPNRQPEDVLAELKKYIDPEMLVGNKETRETNFFLRLYDNLQYVLPMNHKTLSLPLSVDSFDVLKTLWSGKKLHLTKYFDALPFYSNLPTEVGLFSYVRFTSPVFFSTEGDINFKVGEDRASIWNLLSSKALSVDMNIHLKVVLKSHARFNVFLPWNKKSISSGADTMKSMNLPMKIQTSLDTQGNMKNLSMNIVPTCQKECIVAHVQNTPYVSISNVFPESWMESVKYEMISVNGEGMGLYKNKHMFDKDFTGLDAGIHHEGDVQYPFNYGNIYDIFNKPYKWFSKVMSPTTKYFKSSLVVNFDTSKTKALHPSISFTMPTKMEDKNMIPKTKKETGEHNVFTMKLLMTGTETRHFEWNFEKKVISEDSTFKRTEYFYKYIQQSPKVKPQSFCIQFETRTPVFNDYKTLLKLLTSQSMGSTLVGKVVTGASCKGSQIASIKGSMKLSENMKKIMIDEITKELTLNKESTLYVEDKPVHDKVSLLVEYKEPLLDHIKNMTYQMYDILRGSQFPHDYHNYCNVKNPKGRIVVEGERHLDGTYDLRTEMPTENMHLDNFELPWMYKLKMQFLNKNIIDEFPSLRVLKMVL